MKILLFVSLLFILLGVPGIRECNMKKRMMALVFSIIGSVGIAFAQTGQYALIGGLQQLLFRGLGIILFCCILSRVCKKNDIQNLDALNGLGRFAPYTYMWLVLLAVFLIGVPGTGTFTGILYTQMGYMYGYVGIIGIVGQIANVVGMIVVCLVVLPILKEGFLSGEKALLTDEGEKQLKRIKGLSIGWHVLVAVVVLTLSVLSIYHNAWSMVVTRIINALM